MQADGADIRTIESVADKNGDLHPLQEAFRDCHALQCGYCTPGMIMNILSHLEAGEDLDLSEKGIREIGQTVALMAEAEGLQAHKNAVMVRLFGILMY